MLGKKKGPPRRIEFHGGPKDGEWMDRPPHGDRVYVHMYDRTVLTGVTNPALDRIQGRVGIYQMHGYTFKGERCTVLRWMGEHDL